MLKSLLKYCFIIYILLPVIGKFLFSYVKQVIHVIAIVESNPRIFTYSMHYNVLEFLLQVRRGSTVY